MKSLKIITLSAIASTSLFAQSSICLENGWNLLGASAAISVNTQFNDADKIDTVWGFDNYTKTWLAYSPDSSKQSLIDSSSSISNLTSIMANTGYWVNSKGSHCLDSQDTQPSYNQAPMVYNIPIGNGPTNSDVDTHQLYVVKGEPVNVDFQDYIKDEEGDTVTIFAENTASFPDGLSISSDGKITGTATTLDQTTTFNLKLEDETNSVYSNLRITVIDAVDYDDDKIDVGFVYGNTLDLSSFDITTAGSFFEPDSEDGAKSFGVISVTNSSVDYKKFDLNSTSGLFEENIEESDSLTAKNVTTTSFELEFTDEQNEKSTVLEVKEVTSIDGQATTGLYEAKVEFEYTSDFSGDYASINDWWPTYHNKDGQPFTSLTSLKDYLVDNQWSNVWINEDTVVYLKSGGVLEKAQWDGLYAKCQGCTDGNDYYKNFIHSGVDLTASEGMWTLTDTGFLEVKVANQGTKVFKEATENNNTSIYETEINPIGAKEIEKWYYGITQTEFETLYKSESSN